MKQPGVKTTAMHILPDIETSDEINVQVHVYNKIMLTNNVNSETFICRKLTQNVLMIMEITS